MTFTYACFGCKETFPDREAGEHTKCGPGAVNRIKRVDLLTDSEREIINE